jgi:hypothetical protein
VLKAVSAVIVALATGIVGAVLGYQSKNREMDVKMVEIAVGILSQEPKEGIAPAREWAVDVINGYSDVKVTPEARAALVKYRAVLPSGGWSGSTSSGRS